ncbi:hypothetical protein D3C72_1472150 [compost metagenome]
MRPRAVICQRQSARGDVLAQHSHQVPHGGGDQAILVLKVVTDDAIRDTGQTGDQRNAGVPHSDLIDRLQSGFDQLLAADGLHTDLGHLAHLLRPSRRRRTSIGLRASLFCFD